MHMKAVCAYAIYEGHAFIYYIRDAHEGGMQYKTSPSYIAYRHHLHILHCRDPKGLHMHHRTIALLDITTSPSYITHVMHMKAVCAYAIYESDVFIYYIRDAHEFGMCI